LAKSADGICAWRDLHFEENLTDPICMGSMTHCNGRIYHSNCDSATERKNLTVKISDDCFKTSHNIRISDMGGYSDIAIWGASCSSFMKSTFQQKEKKLNGLNCFLRP
jgi:hypothetical protein